jgi:hypothetical protein
MSQKKFLIYVQGPPRVPEFLASTPRFSGLDFDKTFASSASFFDVILHDTLAGSNLDIHPTS